MRLPGNLSQEPGELPSASRPWTGGAQERERNLQPLEPPCAEIRNRSFRKELALDSELQSMVRNYPSHRFLLNPAALNAYSYLVDFVQAFSEARFAKPISRISILDWGCGKGQVSFLLKRRAARVTSCDYCGENHPNGDSSFGQDTPIIRSAGIAVDRMDDPVQLSYPEGSFDVVLSFGVLEHVRSDIDSLREIRRVLCPGGVLFCFYLPYFLSWTQRVSRLFGNDYHDRLYTSRRVQELLGATGYELLDLWYRQLLPKNTIRYPSYRWAEALDQTLVRFTPLKYLATNIEFVAVAR
jgi:SAM-dependent methyltransferase